VQRLLPIISATGEVEIRRIAVGGQANLGKKFPSQQNELGMVACTAALQT
jgi:hypothetical protein